VGDRPPLAGHDLRSVPHNILDVLVVGDDREATDTVQAGEDKRAGDPRQGRRHFSSR
jgi:hypothetical protein